MPSSTIQFRVWGTWVLHFSVWTMHWVLLDKMILICFSSVEIYEWDCENFLTGKSSSKDLGSQSLASPTPSGLIAKVASPYKENPVNYISTGKLQKFQKAKEVWNQTKLPREVIFLQLPTSGRQGLSYILATRCSPLPFLRLILWYIKMVKPVWLECLKNLVVEACAIIFPPIGFLGSAWLGFAMTTILIWRVFILLQILELYQTVKYLKCEEARYLEHCPSIHLRHHLVGDHHSHPELVCQPVQIQFPIPSLGQSSCPEYFTTWGEYEGTVQGAFASRITRPSQNSPSCHQIGDHSYWGYCFEQCQTVSRVHMSAREEEKTPVKCSCAVNNHHSIPRLRHHRSRLESETF